MTIELRSITKKNYFDVLNLEVHPNQRNFIASNSISLAEAYVYDKNGDFIAPLAVYDKEVLIGFVVIAYDQKIGISKGNYLLFRFMIDKRFQGLGYFKPTMDAVIDFVRTEPAEKQQVFGYLMNQKINMQDLAISIMDLKKLAKS